MAVEWKKILFSGEVDLTSSDVTGNQKDLVGGDGINLTGGGDNVLIGTDSDLSLAVDIMGVDEYLGSVQVANDYLLIHDHSTNSGGAGTTNLKRISVSDLIADIGDGVSSITFSGDATGSTNISITSTGTVNIQGDTNEPIEFETSSATNTISASLGSAKITGGGSYSGNVFADRGVASFDADNFAHADTNETRIKIKADGVGATEIAGLSITNAHIANNAAINDSKLGQINNTGKVATNAVDIAGTQGLGVGSISAQDKILVHDVSGTIGSGAHNYAPTVGQLQAFIDGNIGGIANAHSGLTAPGDVDEGGLTYVSDVTFDDYGHITAIGTDSVQVATETVAGIVSVGTQEFGGHKQFDRITISDDSSIDGAGDLLVEGTATINGDLIVSGETTTLNVATLNVEDSTIVGAVPETAYDDTQAGINAARAASSGGGFFLHSHNDANVDNYAGFKWKEGGRLTGWAAQNTADNSDAASSAFPVAVMTFTDGVPDNTVDAAGVGSFYLDTTSGSEGLYIRIT